jgi:hypothetical protein
MSIKNLAVASIAATTLVVATAGTALACTKPQTKTVDHKVGICHATGSKTNPYVFITVDEHAVKAHQSHQDGHDIIGAKSAADCPKPPKQTPAPTPPVQGKGQVLSTTQTLAPTPAQVVTPTELPKTGAGTAGLSALAGLPTLAVTGRAYLRSRQAK